MACNHEWVGPETGVTCIRCGLSLTAKQYQNFLGGANLGPSRDSDEEPKEAKPAVKKTAARKPAAKK